MNDEAASMIHVLAIITANPGQRAMVLEAFRANVAAVRAEEGCIEYGAVVDTEGFGGFQTKFGPDTFAVIEKWASADALKAHAGAPHMAAYAAKTKPMLASRIIHVLSPA
jgi:quinol monooxygenase YgiN